MADNETDRVALLAESLKNIIAAMSEIYLAVNKLGKVQDLEWSRDIKDWVSADKLEELKQNPR